MAQTQARLDPKQAPVYTSIHVISTQVSDATRSFYSHLSKHTQLTYRLETHHFKTGVVSPLSSSLSQVCEAVVLRIRVYKHALCLLGDNLAKLHMEEI